MGPGPEGTIATNHWEVTFEDGAYEYADCDVIESGSYSWIGENGAATLEGTASNSNLTYVGTFDPGSGVLEWDGVRYRPIESI